jgi:hypothetical protein
MYSFHRRRAPMPSPRPGHPFRLLFPAFGVEPGRRHASDPETVASELLGAIGAFTTADEVNLLLGNLIKQLARKRIARRDAIGSAYISQLLLNRSPRIPPTRPQTAPILFHQPAPEPATHAAIDPAVRTPNRAGQSVMMALAHVPRPMIQFPRDLQSSLGKAGAGDRS